MTKTEIEVKIENYKSLGTDSFGMCRFDNIVDNIKQRHYELRLYPLVIHIEVSRVLDIKIIIMRFQVGIYIGGLGG